MDLVQTAITLGAIVTTIGTSVIIRPSWSARIQALLALAVSAVLGVAAAAQQGALDHLDWHNTKTVLQAVGVVYAASQVAFHGLWKPSGAATLVETVTSPATAVKLSKDEVLIAGIARAISAEIGKIRATVPAPVISAPALTPAPSPAPVASAASS